MKRALTLIEVLVSLGLLTALAVASSSWIALTGRASLAASQRGEHSAAIEAVFALVHDDVIQGDFASAESHVPRIEVSDDVLRIRTRICPLTSTCGAGEALHEYRFEPDSGHGDGGSLMLRESTSEGCQQERFLVPSLAIWRCTLDHEARELTIELGFMSAAGSTRRYPVP